MGKGRAFGFFCSISLGPSCFIGGADEVDAPVPDVCEGQEGGGLVSRVSPYRSSFKIDLDILFIIDNTSGMGYAQARLGKGIDSLLDKLDDSPVPVHYRIGVTTTDTGNPSCGETPQEKGALRLDSCGLRLDDFVLDGNDHSEFCTNICQKKEELKTLPSLSSDGGSMPRSWIESIDGKTNLPDSWSVTEAFRCIAPQGLHGCHFRSPLQSLREVRKSSSSRESSTYNFFRPDAHLAVIVLTNGLDCSYGEEHANIFSKDGEQVFWSNHEDGPHPGICWEAGVKCEVDASSGGSYGDCHPANFDLNGKEFTPSSVGGRTPVLGALEDYISDVLYRGGFEKSFVSVFSGVPIGKSGESEGVIEYYAPKDDAGLAMFGVQSGCTTQEEGGFSALPPVRLREFARALSLTEDTPRLYSACAEDYAPRLGAIGEQIVSNTVQSCYPECVHDIDPSQDGLQPECEVYYVDSIFSEERRKTLRECSKKGGEYMMEKEQYVIPGGEDRCYVLLTDLDGRTGNRSDDITGNCLSQHNLEIRVERREGVLETEAETAMYYPECTVSTCPQTECPGWL